MADLYAAARQLVYEGKTEVAPEFAEAYKGASERERQVICERFHIDPNNIPELTDAEVSA